MVLHGSSFQIDSRLIATTIAEPTYAAVTRD
jgi:hypothetical protein